MQEEHPRLKSQFEDVQELLLKFPKVTEDKAVLEKKLSDLQRNEIFLRRALGKFNSSWISVT
jgi:hypothetical protein